MSASIQPAPLPNDWPPRARDLVAASAVIYLGECRKPWPDTDALREQAIARVLADLDCIGRDDLDDCSDGAAAWIERWECCEIEPEIGAAIEYFYRGMAAALDS